MAQVDFVNYFSILIWFNFLILFFYLLNYTCIIPIIYNNIFIRSKLLLNFIIKNKYKYDRIFLLNSKNISRFFSLHDFCKINISIYNIYSNIIIYKTILC
jgi:hypothetical protein